jgi:hypothetical protein
MPAHQSSSSGHGGGKRPVSSRGEELRQVIRVDLVVYAVVGVVLILALATLLGVEPDHTLVGTLISAATGIIGAVLAYLRYRNGKEPRDGNR